MGEVGFENKNGPHMSLHNNGGTDVPSPSRRTSRQSPATVSPAPATAADHACPVAIGGGREAPPAPLRCAVRSPRKTALQPPDLGGGGGTQAPVQRPADSLARRSYAVLGAPHSNTTPSPVARDAKISSPAALGVEHTAPDGYLHSRPCRVTSGY